MIQKKLTVNMTNGINARSGSIIAEESHQFSSDVFLEYQNKKVNLKSLMGVLSLGLNKGDEVLVTLDGENEKEELAYFEKLFEEME